jgi:hypothetical protein
MDVGDDVETAELSDENISDEGDEGNESNAGSFMSNGLGLLNLLDTLAVQYIGFRLLSILPTLTKVF